MELKYHPDDEWDTKYQDHKEYQIRKVSYQDEQNRYYKFLRTNFEIGAEEVAFI